MAKTNLSAPWVEFYREVNALFGDDPEIKVIYDEDDLIIRLLVDNPIKADAIAQLLPTEKAFGNVVVRISVVPANEKKPSKIDLIKVAFQGNPAFSYAVSAVGVFTNPIHYVVFANKVVQYFNDDLGDVNGNVSTLYQNIAADVLGPGDEGICYCTDVPKE